MDYRETLRFYLEDLSSGKPAPGGGSASALVSAISSALILMVTNFTLGKDEFREVEDEVRRIYEEAEKIKKDCLQLVDEDVKAYQEYVKARRLPRGSEEEKKIRKEKMAQALEKAAQVPLRIMRKAVRLLQLNQNLMDKSNPRLRSDVYVSIEFAWAGLLSAKYNVEVNLPYLEEKKEVLEKEMRRLTQEGEKIYNTLKESFSL